MKNREIIEKCTAKVEYSNGGDLIKIKIKKYYC